MALAVACNAPGADTQVDTNEALEATSSLNPGILTVDLVDSF